MTATINIFSMPRVITLTMGGNTGATLMNYPVNRTDFTLTKGVKTEILFFIKDVDRKNVTLNGFPRVVIVDTRTNRQLMDRPMTQGAQAGLWKFTIASGDIEFWELGYYRYTVIVEDNMGEQVMLYTDRGYTPNGTLEVIQGPFPTLPEATVINESDFLSLSGSLISGAYEGSSVVGNPTGLNTAVFHITDFVGTLKIQASLEDQPSADDFDWFDAATVTFNDPETGPYYMEALGQYMWLRFVVTKTIPIQGTFEKVVYRAF